MAWPLLHRSAVNPTRVIVVSLARSSDPSELPRRLNRVHRSWEQRCPHYVEGHESTCELGHGILGLQSGASPHAGELITNAARREDLLIHFHLDTVSATCPAHPRVPGKVRFRAEALPGLTCLHLSSLRHLPLPVPISQALELCTQQAHQGRSQSAARDQILYHEGRK